MPKFAVALISGALTGVIGFLLGALFTVPQNEEMERLVNAKSELTQQINVLKSENDKLSKGGAHLKKQVLDLKDKLLKAYEVKEETEIF